ncbi:SGNH/GDSL hydrolase family protein [Pseudarthrobacter sp. NIBRBAC000502770]|uniref:SGNH/GDSL hydrolase family protein n=1 Tax=Pseudarthrobacter sp. NIBRBAC000502770 TaxID=2590785 RepID=UPI001FEE2CB8|nr:SGNH/GDSL hydrolase family protein [Pseudarthrobacter sp. NIBRBAC000502770]
MKRSAARRRYKAFASGLASMAIALGLAAIPAQAATPQRDVDYVALGDSYTAGTGADTSGLFVPTPPCTQTAGGYVDIVDGADLVNRVANAACHGSLLTRPTWDGVTSVADQLTQLTTSGDLSKDTELVSMTAGANDVGVNTVLFVCATSITATCGQAVDAAAATMPSVGADLVKVLSAIHKQAPRARIVVLGYPRLFNPAGVPIIPVDNQALVNRGTALLNTTIAASVATANILYGANSKYVDVTAGFAGHEVNTAVPWIFLASSVDASGVPQFDPRSFHPTKEGHAAYAAALLSSVKLTQLARP